jgi:hypothetical protein
VKIAKYPGPHESEFKYPSDQKQYVNTQIPIPPLFPTISPHPNMKFTPKKREN